MKNVKWGVDILLVVLLIFLSGINILPKSVSMPDHAMIAAYALTLVVFTAFLAFWWNDRPADERELLLQHQASRAAYLVGTAILIVALVVQGFRHHVDAVLPIVLLFMVASKVISVSARRRA